MKPKIDLTAPFVQFVIKHHKKQVETALNTPQTVESSIIPICAVPKTKAHQKPKTKPEQIGSGVLVKIKDQYFIFSATHVFLEFGSLAIITGDGHGTQAQQILGERFSRGNPNSPKESSLDASVFHIQSEISESLKQFAITLNDFDFETTDTSKPIYMASGFRVKISNTVGESIKSRRECFPSIELDAEDYEKLSINPETHIILSYEDQVLVKNRWQTSPIPKGISGGAIIKVVGTSLMPTSINKQRPRQLLTAITIEQRREKGDNPGILIGTRIVVHLGLIYQFLPELLTDFIESRKIE